MAIAGLENASVIDSSFPHNSQPQAFRHREDDGRASFRASSLLQMWRELEDDHVMSHARDRYSDRSLHQRSDPPVTNILREDVSDNNVSEHSCVSDGANLDESELVGCSLGPSHVVSQNSREDLSPFSCEHSSDLGVVERERVRKIFREWMNSGMCEPTSVPSHANGRSRGEWLGETEQERVRIIREWVQMNSQQRVVSADTSEEQPAEVTTQIERVLDGMVANDNEHIKRGIRKLCGRQALLDMLKTAEKERQRELKGLMERHAVSNFAHRNRIQSLLRGRFLRNGGMADNERPTSSAASELGFLRERQTVSGLREEFVSRLVHSVSGQTSTSQSDTSSNADTDCNRNEDDPPSSLHNGNHANATAEQNGVETDNQGFSLVITDSGDDITQSTSLQQRTALEEEWQENMVRELQELDNDEFSERRENAAEAVLHSLQREDGARELSFEYETRQHDHLQDASEVFYEQSRASTEDSSVQNANPNITQEEQLCDEGLQNEESDWQVIGGEFGEARDDIDDVVDVNMEENSPNHLPQELVGDESIETQPSEVDLQQSMHNRLEGSSDQDGVSFARVDTHYLPDEDNVSNVELQELLSRRRVSNLLRSGFRESLDQIIQSYIERQSHTPVDWEQHEAYLNPELAGQEMEHRDRDGQNEDQGGGVDESPSLSQPSLTIPLQSLWDHEQQNSNWPPRDMHQTIDWEVINDLRIDMARLQQRMNNLQRMLEACMDMQLELQRSIRQEVSSAMNRAASAPSATSEENIQSYESRWEYVRKGICCICCHSSIDSLLYRCGHMCACSNCADEVVRRGGKCPMCRAPVIEAVRAYSIL